MNFFVFFAFLTTPAIVKSATITLFSVRTTTLPDDYPKPSETYSVIGVGADGATTYLNDITYSVILQGPLNGPLTTSDGKTVFGDPPLSTVTKAPKTLHATLIEDASHYVFSVAAVPGEWKDNLVVSCEFDGRGSGVCVQRVWADGGPTSITSLTGSVVPVHTLVTSGGNGMKPASQLLFSSGVVIIGILVGFSLVI